MGSLGCLFFSLLTLASTSRPSSFPGAIPVPEGELQPSIRTGYTCEGEELVVKCDEEETIQIIRANYGRFSIAICNDDGKTHWSVNCMSPKTRHILQNKCDRLNSCTVPVSSDLFGDPCPGTHKYVEIHYTCSPKTDTTRRPLPPWYLQPPPQSNSDGKHDLWLPNSSKQKQKDIAPNGNEGSGKNFNSRIPILVATTTSTPKRIPITTPKPTTISSTTTTTESTTEKATSKEVLMEPNNLPINQEDREQDSDILMTNSPDNIGVETLPSGDIGLEDIPEDQLNQYCHATTARNLYWKFTKNGQVVIQPCPNGATGLARWQCSSERSSIISGSHGVLEVSVAKWGTDQPDMSDCKSVPMTNLEVKVRQEDPENVIASSLARLTGSRKLYGGDLQSAVAVMRTVANRIQYLLQQRSEKFYKKEAFIQEVLLNIVRSGSNLLDVKNKEAWNDLDLTQQMKVASSLLLAMEENAFLFAEVTNKPEILMESSYNILMAISVLNVKDIRNGSSFPLNNYEEPYGTIEDSIFLPLEALERNARDKLVKAVFFSFKQLDEILSKGDKKMNSLSFHLNTSPKQILNSRVISASLVRGKHIQLPSSAPVRVSLKHLREDGMTNPSCVFWDLESSAWSTAGCRVLESNISRTLCECNHLTNFALLMEEQSAPIVIQLPAFHIEIIIASVMAVLILITFLLVFKFRVQVHKFVLKSPCFKEEKKGLENCHKSQSFFTGINLMPTNGGEKSQTMSTTVPDSQTRLSQYILNNGAQQMVPTYEEDLKSERYEEMNAERYEDINSEISCNQATLPMRAPMPVPATHITLNPYSTQLVDNINRMMAGGQQVPVNHIYQVAMSPHLSQLTNTLRKKKCLGGHPGPCHHNRSNNPVNSDSSQRSDSLTPQGDNETDTEIIPNSSDVVFRAVSPHGHVYWEIDPKRPNKLAQPEHQSDEDTNNDLHNMSDFSEDDGKVISDRSRQSSSRFSDNRPLISSTNTSPGHINTMSPMNLALSGLSPLPEGIGTNHGIQNFSPSHRELRFNSLQKAHIPVSHTGFSTRTRLGRHPRMQAGADSLHDQNDIHSGLAAEHLQQRDTRRMEHLQQQVQIPDLRRLPVSVKSSEYIMAKIQNHMDQRNNLNRQGPGQKEREV